jgi:hypothetical protein
LITIAVRHPYTFNDFKMLVKISTGLESREKPKLIGATIICLKKRGLPL